MPTLTWIDKNPPKRKVNYLAALMRQYKLDRKMTSAQMAEALYCKPESVRRQFGKPADTWRVGTIIDYCDVLGIPYEEAFAAAAKK
jgi:hypothetical protein